MLSSPVSSPRKRAPDSALAIACADWPTRVLAACVAFLMVWLISQLLLIRPDLAQPRDEVRIRLSFIELTTLQAPKTRPSVPARPHAASPPPRASPLAPRPIEQAVSEPLLARLYTRQGRVNLPQGAQIDSLATEAATSPPGLPNARDLARANKLLERPNPIDYRSTRFDKAWTTDGTLGDAMVESMDEGLKGMAKALAGRQDQPAQARPPPEVRFNPNLHERPSDLGSEATGDAYKAAPIAFEKAPGLAGEASKRLRSELSSLKKQFSHCSAQRWAQVIGPINVHLTDLERVEYAYGHGADPVQVEHLLPRAADSAFDQTRRALWYANRRLASCMK